MIVMMRISCPLTLALTSNTPPLVVVVPHVLQYGLRSQTLTPGSDLYKFLHHVVHTPVFVFLAFICFVAAHCMNSAAEQNFGKVLQIHPPMMSHIEK